VGFFPPLTIFFFFFCSSFTPSLPFMFTQKFFPTSPPKQDLPLLLVFFHEHTISPQHASFLTPSYCSVKLSPASIIFFRFVFILFFFSFCSFPLTHVSLIFCSPPPPRAVHPFQCCSFFLAIFGVFLPLRVPDSFTPNPSEVGIPPALVVDPQFFFYDLVVAFFIFLLPPPSPHSVCLALNRVFRFFPRKVVSRPVNPMPFERLWVFYIFLPVTLTPPLD